MKGLKIFLFDLLIAVAILNKTAKDELYFLNNSKEI